MHEFLYGLLLAVALVSLLLVRLTAVRGPRAALIGTAAATSIIVAGIFGTWSAWQESDSDDGCALVEGCVVLDDSTPAPADEAPPGESPTGSHLAWQLDA
jgi:hypothetical protein